MATSGSACFLVRRVTTSEKSRDVARTLCERRARRRVRIQVEAMSVRLPVLLLVAQEVERQSVRCWLFVRRDAAGGRVTVEEARDGGRCCLQSEWPRPRGHQGGRPLLRPAARAATSGRPNACLCTASAKYFAQKGILRLTVGAARAAPRHRLRLRRAILSERAAGPRAAPLTSRTPARSGPGTTPSAAGGRACAGGAQAANSGNEQMPGPRLQSYRSLAVSHGYHNNIATTQNAPLLHDTARQRQTAQPAAAARWRLPAARAVREAPDGPPPKRPPLRGCVGQFP